MAPRTPRVCAAIALAACGCSYDWTVPAGSSLLDAGNEVDATVLPDGGVSDASDASDSALDSPAATADAADCAALIAAADSAYTQARTCTVGDTCTTAKDRCGCSQPVDESTAATDAYVQAVAAIAKAGCSVPCPQCPAPPSSPKCIDTANGEGGVTAICE